MIFKQTSLANIISYPIKPFSCSALFIKVIKIIHKHNRLLHYNTFLSKFFRILNALKQQQFSHQVKTSAKIFKWTSLANIISYPTKPPHALNFSLKLSKSFINIFFIFKNLTFKFFHFGTVRYLKYKFINIITHYKAETKQMGDSTKAYVCLYRSLKLLSDDQVTPWQFISKHKLSCVIWIFSR